MIRNAMQELSKEPAEIDQLIELSKLIFHADEQVNGKVVIREKCLLTFIETMQKAIEQQSAVNGQLKRMILTEEMHGKVLDSTLACAAQAMQLKQTIEKK